MLTSLVILVAACQASDATADIDALLRERETVYDGPLGEVLVARDAVRRRASLAFIEAELLRYASSERSRWWSSREADGTAWHREQQDLACDNATATSLRALRKARYAGSLSSALRLSQHLSCARLLTGDACRALDLVVDCAGSLLVGQGGPDPFRDGPGERLPVYGMDDAGIDALVSLEWELEDLPPVHGIVRHRQRYGQIAEALGLRLQTLERASGPVEPEAWCSVHGDRLRLAIIEPEAFTDPSRPEQPRGVMQQSALAIAASVSGCPAQREQVRDLLQVERADDLWDMIEEMPHARLVLGSEPVRVDGVVLAGTRSIVPGLHLVQRSGGQTSIEVVGPDQLFAPSPDSAGFATYSPKHMD